jgi:hypothetical protein
MRASLRSLAMPALSLLLGATLAGPRGAHAADGQMVIGVHITIAPRWLDPERQSRRSRRSWCSTLSMTRS